MEKGRVHLIISGFVQGVFYRASTRNTAERLGLQGWVRNLPDGNVEVVFEGPIDKLQEGVEWCHAGPPGARVAGINEEWDNFSGEFKGFNIIYS